MNGKRMIKSVAKLVLGGGLMFGAVIGGCEQTVLDPGERTGAWAQNQLQTELRHAARLAPNQIQIQTELPR